MASINASRATSLIVDDLFTIVSLVIAVSGATYAALLAIRDYFKEGLLSAIEESATHLGQMKDTTNPAIKERCCKRVAWRGRWHSVWNWSYCVPIVIFIVISYCQAIHVIYAYWTVGAAKPDSGWAFYKWVLLIMTIIDALCVILTFVARWVIHWICGDIAETYRTELYAQTANLAPSPSAPTAAVEPSAS